jgi:hypothetical protein
MGRRGKRGSARTDEAREKRGSKQSDDVKAAIDDLNNLASLAEKKALSEFRDGTGEFPVALPESADFKKWNESYLIEMLLELGEPLLSLIRSTAGYPSAERAGELEKTALLLAPAARDVLSNTLSVESRKVGDIYPDLIAAMAKDLDVEDWEYLVETAEGANLGIACPIRASHGLWPKAKPKDKKVVPLSVCPRMSKSAVNNKEFVLDTVLGELEKGWVVPFEGEIVTRVTTSVVEKTADDGAVKRRLIQDYKANGVNSLIELGETISLPTLMDINIMVEVAESCLEDGDELATFELDIASAFRLFPVNPSEQKFLVFEVEDVDGSSLTAMHQRLPFGLKSSPYIFSRAFAVIFRILRKVTLDAGIVAVIYVDDSFFVGSRRVLSQVATVVILILVAFGVSLSWKKLKLPGGVGSMLGFEITESVNGAPLRAELSAVRCSKLAEEVAACNVAVCDAAKLRSVVGKLVWASSLWPPVRSNMAALFGISALAERRGWRVINMSQEARASLEFWHAKLSSKYGIGLCWSMGGGHRPWIVASDASLSSIAAFAFNRETSVVRWLKISVASVVSRCPHLVSNEISSGDINILELIAILLGLCLLRGERAISLSDSMVSMHVVRKGVYE